MEQFYSVKEVAEKYGLTEDTIRHYIHRGQIKTEKFNNRTHMIKESDLRAWESTRTEKPWKKRAKK